MSHHGCSNDLFQRYWRSYDRAMAWYRKHQVAVWKSEAAAQSYLKSAFQERLIRGNDQLCRQPVNNNEDTDMAADEEHQGEDSMSEEFEFQITDEMAEFFETSRKHKEELSTLSN